MATPDQVAADSASKEMAAIEALSTSMTRKFLEAANVA